MKWLPGFAFVSIGVIAIAFLLLISSRVSSETAEYAQLSPTGFRGEQTSIFVTTNGTIFVSYLCYTTNNTNFIFESDAYLTVSTDAGKTFSPPVLLGNEYSEFRYSWWGCINVDNNGTIYLIGYVRRGSDALDGEVYILLGKSYDGGTSFEITKVMGNLYPYGASVLWYRFEMHIDYMGTIYLGFSMDNDLWLMKSSDHGSSFQQIIKRHHFAIGNSYFECDGNLGLYVAFESLQLDNDSKTHYLINLLISANGGRDFSVNVSYDIGIMDSTSGYGLNALRVAENKNIYLLYWRMVNYTNLHYLLRYDPFGELVSEALLNISVDNGEIEFMISSIEIDDRDSILLFGNWTEYDSGSVILRRSGLFYAYSNGSGTGFGSISYLEGPGQFTYSGIGFLEEDFLYIAFQEVMNGPPDTIESYQNTSVFLIKLHLFNSPPQAIIASPEERSIHFRDELIVFDGSASKDVDNDVLSFYWILNHSNYLGDGANFSARLPIGDYSIMLWVEDGFGHNVSTMVNISVVNRPPVPLISNPKDNDTFYSHVMIDLNGTSSYDPDGDNMSYSWIVDGATVYSGTSPTFRQRISKGRHLIILNVSDSLGAARIASINVTVTNAPPVARILANRTVVLTDESVTFNCSGSEDPDGLIHSYLLDFGDGNRSVNPSGSHSYSDDGTYIVNLTVRDDEGAENSVSINIQVKNRPPTVIVTNEGKGFTGEELAFDASGSSDQDGSIMKYLWDFGDGENATGAMVRHTFRQSGRFTVTVRAIDDDGEEGAASVSVRINPKGDLGLGWVLSAPFWLIVGLACMALILFWKAFR